MLAKAVIFTLALNAIKCTVVYNNGLYSGYGSDLLGVGLSSYDLGIIPVLRDSALYGADLGGLGYGYGAGLDLRGDGLLANYGGGAHALTAAVHRLGRTVEYRTVPYAGKPIAPQVFNIPPNGKPVHIDFQSKSSSLKSILNDLPMELYFNRR